MNLDFLLKNCAIHYTVYWIIHWFRCAPPSWMPQCLDSRRPGNASPRRWVSYSLDVLCGAQATERFVRGDVARQGKFRAGLFCRANFSRGHHFSLICIDNFLEGRFVKLSWRKKTEKNQPICVNLKGQCHEKSCSTRALGWWIRP